MVSSIAAIDFGTNTFHLIITKTDEPNRLEVIERRRYFVYLDRSNSRYITNEAIETAKEASRGLKQVLIRNKCSKIYAVGTEVFRKKQNGPELLDEISQILDVPIQLISGDEEAELIFHGVANSFRSDEPYLIMDIGGGSTEFILSANDQAAWKASFKIGLSILMQLVDYEDQLESKQMHEIQEFYLDKIEVLSKVIAQYRPSVLLINGGAGELLPHAIQHEELGGGAVALDKAEFYKLCDALILSDLESRERYDWLHASRIKLFPLFLLNVKLILNYFKIDKLVYTGAGLKEGLIITKNNFR